MGRKSANFDLNFFIAFLTRSGFETN